MEKYFIKIIFVILIFVSCATTKEKETKNISIYSPNLPEWTLEDCKEDEIAFSFVERYIETNDPFEGLRKSKKNLVERLKLTFNNIISYNFEKNIEDLKYKKVWIEKVKNDFTKTVLQLLDFDNLIPDNIYYTKDLSQNYHCFVQKKILKEEILQKEKKALDIIINNYTSNNEIYNFLLQLKEKYK